MKGQITNIRKIAKGNPRNTTMKLTRSKVSRRVDRLRLDPVWPSGAPTSAGLVMRR